MVSTIILAAEPVCRWCPETLQQQCGTAVGTLHPTAFFYTAIKTLSCIEKWI